MFRVSFKPLFVFVRKDFAFPYGVEKVRLVVFDVNLKFVEEFVDMVFVDEKERRQRHYEKSYDLFSHVHRLVLRLFEKFGKFFALSEDRFCD